MTGLLNDDLAVSETLGYILLFGVLLTCTGMILLVGGNIINDTQDRTSFQGVEQSFNIISSDLKKTAFEAIPVKTSQLKFEQGTMHLADNDFRIMVYHDDVLIYENTSMDLYYISGTPSTGILKIQDGAVIKDFGPDQSVMMEPPRIYYSPENQALMVTVINLDGNMTAIGNSALCNVRMSFSSYNITTSTTGSPENATICIKSSATKAWRGQLTHNMDPRMTDVSGASYPVWSNSTLTGVKKVVVSEYWINVRLY